MIIWLVVVLIYAAVLPCNGISQSFVNSSVLHERPTFVVNFDMSTVICQHSKDPEDLHLHDISILCDGHADCYSSEAMNDESFPYCEKRCNSTCSHHGACLFDGKRAQCYCNSGFQGPSCELTDTNECNEKPCHWMAKCQNTFGSYRCECYPGFEGNGYECTDIDECADGLADCPSNSICVNLPGTYMCNCSQGYTPRGTPADKCVDIDECELGLAKCSNGYCQNTIGDFKCVNECEDEYALKEGICVDVDECAEGLQTCDSRATCANTPGGYQCFCDDGFFGDGKTCSPLYDCTQNEAICDRHAYCLSSLKMCVCQSGYSGDGHTCRDINECNGSMNPCSQQSNSKCVNVEGGYVCCEQEGDQERCLKESGLFCSGGCGVNAVCFNHTCTCVPGFDGDPKSRCLDVNECHQDNICTGAGQWCVNLVGGHICCTSDSDYPECRGLELVPDPEPPKAVAISNAEAKNNNGNRNKAEANSFAQVTGIRDSNGGEIEENEFAAREKVKRKRFRTKTVHLGRQLKTHSGGFVLIRRPKEHLVRNETTGEFELKEIPNCPNGQDSECPEHSVCFNNRCRCRLGFEWSHLKGGCEDINECLGPNPCPHPPNNSWCVNTVGTYHCCHPGMDMKECDGMIITDMEPSSSVISERDENGEGIFNTISFGELHKKVSKHIIFGRGRIPIQRLWGLELTGKGLLLGIPESEEGPTDQAHSTLQPSSVSTTLFTKVSIAPLGSRLIGPPLPPGQEHRSSSVLSPSTSTNTVDKGGERKFSLFNRTEGSFGFVAKPKDGSKSPSNVPLRFQNPFVIPPPDFSIPDINPDDFPEIKDDSKGGQRRQFKSFNHTFGSAGLVLGPNMTSGKKLNFRFPQGSKQTQISTPNAIFHMKTAKGMHGSNETERTVNNTREEIGLVLRALPQATSTSPSMTAESTSTTAETESSTEKPMSTRTVSVPQDEKEAVKKDHRVSKSTSQRPEIDILPEGSHRIINEEEFIPQTPPPITRTTVNGDEWVVEGDIKGESVQIPESQETLVLTAAKGFKNTTKVAKKLTSDITAIHFGLGETKGTTTSPPLETHTHKPTESTNFTSTSRTNKTSDLISPPSQVTPSTHSQAKTSTSRYVDDLETTLIPAETSQTEENTSDSIQLQTTTESSDIVMEVTVNIVNTDRGHSNTSISNKPVNERLEPTTTPLNTITANSELTTELPAVTRADGLTSSTGRTVTDVERLKTTDRAEVTPAVNAEDLTMGSSALLSTETPQIEASTVNNEVKLQATNKTPVNDADVEYKLSGKTLMNTTDSKTLMNTPANSRLKTVTVKPLDMLTPEPRSVGSDLTSATPSAKIGEKNQIIIDVKGKENIHGTTVGTEETTEETTDYPTNTKSNVERRTSEVTISEVTFTTERSTEKTLRQTTPRVTEEGSSPITDSDQLTQFSTPFHTTAVQPEDLSPSTTPDNAMVFGKIQTSTIESLDSTEISTTDTERNFNRKTTQIPQITSEEEYKKESSSIVPMIVKVEETIGTPLPPTPKSTNHNDSASTLIPATRGFNGEVTTPTTRQAKTKEEYYLKTLPTSGLEVEMKRTTRPIPKEAKKTGFTTTILDDKALGTISTTTPTSQLEEGGASKTASHETEILPLKTEAVSELTTVSFQGSTLQKSKASEEIITERDETTTVGQIKGNSRHSMTSSAGLNSRETTPPLIQSSDKPLKGDVKKLMEIPENETSNTQLTDDEVLPLTTPAQPEQALSSPTVSSTPELQSHTSSTSTKFGGSLPTASTPILNNTTRITDEMPQNPEEPGVKIIGSDGITVSSSPTTDGTPATKVASTLPDLIETETAKLTTDGISTQKSPKKHEEIDKGTSIIKSNSPEVEEGAWNNTVDIVIPTKIDSETAKQTLLTSAEVKIKGQPKKDNSHVVPEDSELMNGMTTQEKSSQTVQKTTSTIPKQENVSTDDRYIASTTIDSVNIDTSIPKSTSGVKSPTKQAITSLKNDDKNRPNSHLGSHKTKPPVSVTLTAIVNRPEKAEFPISTTSIKITDNITVNDIEEHENPMNISINKPVPKLEQHGGTGDFGNSTPYLPSTTSLPNLTKKSEQSTEGNASTSKGLVTRLPDDTSLPTITTNIVENDSFETTPKESSEELRKKVTELDAERLSTKTPDEESLALPDYPEEKVRDKLYPWVPTTLSENPHKTETSVPQSTTTPEVTVIGTETAATNRGEAATKAYSEAMNNSMTNLTEGSTTETLSSVTSDFTKGLTTEETKVENPSNAVTGNNPQGQDTVENRKAMHTNYHHGVEKTVTDTALSESTATPTTSTASSVDRMTNESKLKQGERSTPLPLTKGFTRRSTSYGVETLIPKAPMGSKFEVKSTTPCPATESPVHQTSGKNSKIATSDIPASTQKSEGFTKPSDDVNAALVDRSTPEPKLRSRNTSENKRSSSTWINGKIEKIQQINETIGQKVVVIEPGVSKTRFNVPDVNAEKAFPRNRGLIEHNVKVNENGLEIFGGSLYTSKAPNPTFNNTTSITSRMRQNPEESGLEIIGSAVITLSSPPTTTSILTTKITSTLPDQIKTETSESTTTGEFDLTMKAVTNYITTKGPGIAKNIHDITASTTPASNGAKEENSEETGHADAGIKGNTKKTKVNEVATTTFSTQNLVFERKTEKFDQTNSNSNFATTESATNQPTSQPQTSTLVSEKTQYPSETPAENERIFSIEFPDVEIDSSELIKNVGKDEETMLNSKMPVSWTTGHSTPSTTTTTIQRSSDGLIFPSRSLASTIRPGFGDHRVINTKGDANSQQQETLKAMETTRSFNYTEEYTSYSTEVFDNSVTEVTPNENQMIKTTVRTTDTGKYEATAGTITSTPALEERKTFANKTYIRIDEESTVPTVATKARERDVGLPNSSPTLRAEKDELTTQTESRFMTATSTMVSRDSLALVTETTSEHRIENESTTTTQPSVHNVKKLTSTEELDSVSTRKKPDEVGLEIRGTQLIKSVNMTNTKTPDSQKLTSRTEEGLEITGHDTTPLHGNTHNTQLPNKSAESTISVIKNGIHEEKRRIEVPDVDKTRADVISIHLKNQSKNGMQTSEKTGKAQTLEERTDRKGNSHVVIRYPVSNKKGPEKEKEVGLEIRGSDVVINNERSKPTTATNSFERSLGTKKVKPEFRPVAESTREDKVQSSGIVTTEASLTSNTFIEEAARSSTTMSKTQMIDLTVESKSNIEVSIVPTENPKRDSSNRIQDMITSKPQFILTSRTSRDEGSQEMRSRATRTTKGFASPSRPVDQVPEEVTTTTETLIEVKTGYKINQRKQEESSHLSGTVKVSKGTTLTPSRPINTDISIPPKTTNHDKTSEPSNLSVLNISSTTSETPQNEDIGSKTTTSIHKQPTSVTTNDKNVIDEEGSSPEEVLLTTTSINSGVNSTTNSIFAEEMTKMLQSTTNAPETELKNGKENEKSTIENAGIKNNTAPSITPSLLLNEKDPDTTIPVPISQDGSIKEDTTVSNAGTTADKEKERFTTENSHAVKEDTTEKINSKTIQSIVVPTVTTVLPNGVTDDITLSATKQDTPTTLATQSIRSDTKFTTPEPKVSKNPALKSTKTDTILPTERKTTDKITAKPSAKPDPHKSRTEEVKPTTEKPATEGQSTSPLNIENKKTESKTTDEPSSSEELIPAVLTIPATEENTVETTKLPIRTTEGSNKSDTFVMSFEPSMPEEEPGQIVGQDTTQQEIRTDYFTSMTELSGGTTSPSAGLISSTYLSLNPQESTLNDQSSLPTTIVYTFENSPVTQKNTRPQILHMPTKIAQSQSTFTPSRTSLEIDTTTSYSVFTAQIERSEYGGTTEKPVTLHQHTVEENTITTTVIPAFRDLLPTSKNAGIDEEHEPTTSPKHYTKLQRETTFDGDHETESSLKDSFGLVISGHPTATTSEVGLVIGRLMPTDDNFPPEREDVVSEISPPQSSSSEVVDVDEAPESPEDLLKKVNELLIQQGHKPISTESPLIPEKELIETIGKSTGSKSLINDGGLLKGDKEPLDGDIGINLIQKERKVQWKNKTIEEGKRLNITYPAGSTILPERVTLPESEIEEATTKSGNVGLEISGKDVVKHPGELGLEINVESLKAGTSTTQYPVIKIDETGFETLDREQLIQRVKALTTPKAKIEVTTSTNKETEKPSGPDVGVEGEDVDKMDRDELIRKLKKITTLAPPLNVTSSRIHKATTPGVDIVPDRGVTDSVGKEETPNKPTKQPKIHDEEGLQLLGEDFTPEPKKLTVSSAEKHLPFTATTTAESAQRGEQGLVISGSGLETSRPRGELGITRESTVKDEEFTTQTTKVLLLETPQPGEQGLVISGKGIQTDGPEPNARTTETPKEDTATIETATNRHSTLGTPIPNEQGLVISGEDIRPLATKQPSDEIQITPTTGQSFTEVQRISPDDGKAFTSDIHIPNPNEQGLMISGADLTQSTRPVLTPKDVIQTTNSFFPTESAAEVESSSIPEDNIKSVHPESTTILPQTLPFTQAKQPINTETPKPDEQGLMISGTDIERAGFDNTKRTPDTTTETSKQSFQTTESRIVTMETPFPEEEGLMINGVDVNPSEPETTIKSTTSTEDENTTTETHTSASAKTTTLNLDTTLATVVQPSSTPIIEIEKEVTDNLEKEDVVKTTPNEIAASPSSKTSETSLTDSTLKPEIRTTEGRTAEFIPEAEEAATIQASEVPSTASSVANEKTTSRMTSEQPSLILTQETTNSTTTDEGIVTITETAHVNHQTTTEGVEALSTLESITTETLSRESKLTSASQIFQGTDSTTQASTQQTTTAEDLATTSLNNLWLTSDTSIPNESSVEPTEAGQEVVSGPTKAPLVVSPEPRQETHETDDITSTTGFNVRQTQTTDAVPTLTSKAESTTISGKGTVVSNTPSKATEETTEVKEFYQRTSIRPDEATEVLVSNSNAVTKERYTTVTFEEPTSNEGPAITSERVSTATSPDNIITRNPLIQKEKSASTRVETSVETPKDISITATTITAVGRTETTTQRLEASAATEQVKSTSEVTPKEGEGSVEIESTTVRGETLIPTEVMPTSTTEKTAKTEGTSDVKTSSKILSEETTLGSQGTTSSSRPQGNLETTNSKTSSPTEFPDIPTTSLEKIEQNQTSGTDITTTTVDATTFGAKTSEISLETSSTREGNIPKDDTTTQSDRLIPTVTTDVTTESSKTPGDVNQPIKEEPLSSLQPSNSKETTDRSIKEEPPVSSTTPLAETTTSTLTCTDDWTDYCRKNNRTCSVNSASNLIECGTCLNGYELVGGHCVDVTDVTPAINLVTPMPSRKETELASSALYTITDSPVKETSLGKQETTLAEAKTTPSEDQGPPSTEHPSTHDNILAESSSPPSITLGTSNPKEITTESTPSVPLTAETTSIKWNKETTPAPEDLLTPSKLATEEKALSTEPSVELPATVKNVTEKPPEDSTIPFTKKLQQTKGTTKHKSKVTTTPNFIPTSTTVLVEVIKTEEPLINIDEGEGVEQRQNEETFTTSNWLSPSPTSPSSTNIRSQCISSDECGDDSHCNRDVGKCECDEGFRPKDEKCEDIDECAEQIHNCHKTSRCFNYIGGYTCECPIGWRMNHVLQCTEINECEERNVTLCHSKASCINLSGNYTCQCNPGYTGDGYHCFENTLRNCNEEEMATTTCTDTHMCLVDSMGKENCERCKLGYDMVNGTCVDVNECVNPDTNRCDINSLCINTQGSYICECRNGYEGDGYNCADVNECSTIKPCHPLARCSNLNGTYMCTCPEGWMGDGRYKCVNPVDRRCERKEYLCSSEKFHSCLSVNVTEDLKSFCECEKGYRFNATTRQCDDIDECMENRNKCNLNTTTCLNYMGGYECDCRRGYEGIGGVCVDIDECQRGIHGCHPTSHCHNEIGSYRCECPAGFISGGSGDCRLQEEQNPQVSEESKSTPVDKWSSTEQSRIILSTTTPVNEETNAETSQFTSESPTPSLASITNSPTTWLHSSSDSGTETPMVTKVPSPTPSIIPESSLLPISHPAETTESTPLEPQSTQRSIPKRTQCTKDWDNYCNGINKICFVDSEELLQCGDCLEGYRSVNGECIPQLGSGNCKENNNCHPNADCINSIWTFSVNNTHSCACKKGYVGDGNHCEDVNECNTIPGLCDSNAECRNTDGSFECNCKPGYSGNGFYCVQNVLNGTNCRTNAILCHPNAFCLIDGSCQCKQEYDGDGIHKCDLRGSSTLNESQGRHTPSYDNSEVLLPQETTTSVSTSVIHVSASFPQIRSIAPTSSSTPSPTPTSESTPAFEQTYIIPQSSPHKVMPNCVLDKNIRCHPMASCNTFSGQCKCRPGHEGDGFTHCSRIWEDCRTDTHLCDLNAQCNTEFGQCECKTGYIGDGLSCAPDRLDCNANSDLCSEFAECMGKRCQCKEGYTGDGMMCFSLTPKLSRNDCLNCHCRADCLDGECQCQAGFTGNGLVCLPDPYDCINYPGVCHMNGYCNNGTRKCECHQEYVGNGYDCTIRKSCIQFPALCHPDADCLGSGQCQCRSGFFGDGTYCKKEISYKELTQVKEMDIPSTECSTYCGYNQYCLNGACKCKTGYSANSNGACIDVDECLTGSNSCSPQAKCYNTEGSYKCSCLKGWSGDGRTCNALQYMTPGVQVECLGDGMKVMFSNLPPSFSGRIYVKGQTDNDYCAKTYNGEARNGVVFDVDLVHCNTYMTSNNTLATSLIVQRHPTFVTSEAESYNVQCSYPLSERIVETKYSISDLEPKEAVVNNGSTPLCQFNVKNLEDIRVDQALVGQILKLTLTISPEPEYAILPRNCYAINLETNDRYQLTDQSGCAIDTDLFPEWKRVSRSQLQAIFRTFKWPESTMIRFECYCTPCDNECLEGKCGQRKQRLSRHISGGNGDLIFDNSSLTFSQVVKISEDEEERRIQKEFERWLSQEEPITSSQIENEFVCMSSVWFITTLVASVISIGTLITVFIMYSKKLRVIGKKRSVDCHMIDDNVSYIQF